ncbi:hypothetical protein ACQ0P8_16370 (plasmid) [Halodesulfovibrio aestuarii]|uniref:Uncharacterized protein n=1 Tax=Halodesulfovibrio aestuarii TaxID=126333 RepID=A0A8G2F935_9BACT|nr:hypothetical protein [Halodesulfovibrio aestuarii]SHJ71756.1 hypothetical protein SAMN05660830_03065 [Halodesulfovibrio aestuarii]
MSQPTAYDFINKLGENADRRFENNLQDARDNGHTEVHMDATFSPAEARKMTGRRSFRGTFLRQLQHEAENANCDTNISVAANGAISISRSESVSENENEAYIDIKDNLMKEMK